MANIAQIICTVMYVGLGLMQIIATVDGTAYFTGLNRFFSWMISIFVGGIPLVGTASGIYGAIKVWGWSLTQAMALFFGPMIAIMILAGSASVYSGMQRR